MFNYHEGTAESVKKNLEICHDQKIRVRIFYGDSNTGAAWQEEHDVTGTIGRSTGPRHVALLIHNGRSMGGGSILTHCIVRMDDTKTGRILYQHPTYNNPADRAEIRGCSNPELPSYVQEVTIDGEVIARFAKNGQAARWVAFMQGKRYSK